MNAPAAIQDRFSLERLGAIVTDPQASKEEKLLAVSVAFEAGKREALRTAKQQPEKTPW